jgi:MurNAc alpha-1-phosphate uridylyltransferase
MKAMILAAGKGTRMGALSDRLPKPLEPVAGRALIDRALDRLDSAGISPVVVNVHHLADRLEAHLTPHVAAGRVLISDERAALLETGGGVKKALPLLGQEPFLVINGDALWTDGSVPALLRLQAAFDPARMDILLLLVRTEAALGYDGAGDLVPLAAGGGAIPVRLRAPDPAAPYMFGGIQVVAPAMYSDTPVGPFSNLEIFKKAIAAGRLYGLVHDGDWMHVGTPEAVADAAARLTVLGEA